MIHKLNHQHHHTFEENILRSCHPFTEGFDKRFDAYLYEHYLCCGCNQPAETYMYGEGSYNHMVYFYCTKHFIIEFAQRWGLYSLSEYQRTLFFNEYKKAVKINGSDLIL